MAVIPARTVVTIAVLTYRRPDDLTELLPLLDAQVRETSGAGILVVDNDPEAGAQETVHRFASPRVTYVHEPRPGIATARNRALDDARSADVLIFIDDDERPSSDWLSLMLRTHEEHQAGGVVGSVVSSFTDTLEPWVEAGRFFDRRRLPTGSEVYVAATNNLLLDMNVLKPTGIRFDAEFGLAGGSDTLFTRQFVAAVGPMVWCDEAVVTDVVPVERRTRDWVLRRAFRSGNSWSRTSLAMATSPVPRLGTRVTLTAQGLARLCGGLAQVLFGVARRDLGSRARGTRTVARGSGMVSGAFGYTYVEYRRPASVVVTSTK